jgi:SAM-dependent methyltransferase
VNQRTEGVDRDIYSNGQYRLTNPEWHVGDSPFKASQVVAIARRNGLSPRSIADIGCGAGEVLRRVVDAFPGSEGTGFEPSPDAATSWPAPTDRLRYVLGGVEEARGQAFDLTMVLDVFEHVDDYMGFLRTLHGLSGHFLLNIPLDMHVLGLLVDHQVVARRQCGHLHYFSVATARATLQDTGFEIVDDQLAPGFAGTDPVVRRRSNYLRALHPLRSALYRVSPAATARLIGGVSLYVLARSANPA